MKWTPQQWTAISDRNRSVIVSAAAGSGKTAVLVERLLGLLSDRNAGIRADSIAVVTFTKDAAAQMKQRLYQAMTEQMNALDETADEEDYLWLLEQQSALSNAQIATINSFCFNLVREHAESCGVSRQFRIADDAEEPVYVQHALETVMQHWSTHRRTDMETLFSFFCTKELGELEDVVRQIAEYMKSLAFADDWMQRAETLCHSGEMLFEELRRSFCTELSEVLAIAETAAPFAEHSMLGGKGNKFLDIYNEDTANIRWQLSWMQNSPMDKILENPMVHTAQFHDFPRVRKNISEENKNTFKLFREAYKKKYLNAVSSYLAPLRFWDEDMQTQSEIIPLLLALTRDFNEELFAEKKRRNALCFDDAERLTLSLLGEIREDGRIHRTEIGEKLSEQFSLIMVDEYQDCNNKQDCLFKLLSHGCVSDENGLHYGSNAFVVGDIKQSIYSFRQANPANFMQALEDSVPLAECGEQGTARIYLNQNFRSSQDVIAFVNGLCSRLMTRQCGEVDYDENESLYFGAEHYSGIRAKTTLLLTGHDAEQETTGDDQAECIAAQIAKMIAEKTPVIRRNGITEPCRPKDFCILLRTKDSHAFEKALADRGIAAVGEEHRNYLLRPEVRLIYHYLRILDNPLTDMSMAAVMLSPIYGFTAQDLTELKSRTKSKRLYLQAKELAGRTLAEAQVLCDKCATLILQFEKLRSEAETMPPEAMVMRIYDETDLLSLQSLYEDAELRRSNLQTFVRLTQSYRERTDLTAEDGIGSWLRYLDSIGDSKKLEAGGLPQSDVDCVAIKTIHKSKGLEYPFVFLAHTERKFSRKSAEKLLHASESGMFGLRLIDKERYYKSATAAYQYLLADIFRKQRSEEMRLFYVALTRAQQQLFISMSRKECIRFCRGGFKPKADGEDRYLMAELLERCPQSAPVLAAEAATMQEWILQYLLSCSEASHLTHALMQEESISSDLVEYVVCNTEAADVMEEPQRMELHASADAETVEKMQKQLAFSYESPQTELVSKYSVTALAHPDDASELHLASPAFLYDPKEENPHSLRGAQRGTAVHKMLQYMDFASAAEDPQAELKRLQADGYLNEAEAEALTTEKLAAFFSSELYSRIAASCRIEKEKQLFVKIGELALPEDSELYQKYAGTDGILIGTMDLLFKEDDGWVLVDYKTDYAKNEEQLLAAYSLQLGLYRKAGEKILGEPIKQAFLYSFTLDRAIEAELGKIKY